jgi:GNAT superfamily N-acetyltransferase
MRSLTLGTAPRHILDLLVDIDDDACALFDEIGLGMNLPAEHDAWLVYERSRWIDALGTDRVMLAAIDGVPVGFAVLGLVDGAPCLDQLSVRRRAMRQGVGTALVRWALTTSAPHPLWLTTYAHVAFNRPFYERAGFVVADPASCGEELIESIRKQRHALPAPEHRIAMVARRGLAG